MVLGCRYQRSNEQCRYDFVDGKWIYKHDGHVFQDRLSSELQELTGREAVDLEPEPQATKAFAGYGADPT